MDSYLEGVWLSRWLFQRGLAAIYVLAFSGALRQFRPLLGEHGLLPVPRFLHGRRLREVPTLFLLHYSDRAFAWLAWTGLVLSLSALLGVSEAGPVWLSALVWLVLWVLYLSIVNVGQTFYGFGWESMLLEAGFFACFLGPASVAPSPIPILLLRWMLFRVELGAGLIKLRHDECWRNLTCLYYHYQTQPLPNPLSRHFHRLPKWMHRGSVLFSHFVQLVVPFGLILPQPGACIAGALLVAHQLVLIVSGNYAWLNWLAVVLAASTLSDGAVLAALPLELPATTARSALYDVVLYLLLGATLLLSIQPTRNFFSKHQRMNFSYNPLHLVNVYGAFGSVTRERFEVIVEGTLNEPLAADEADAAADSDEQGWRAYEFKAKPGDPRRRPPQIAPIHLRLDWLMWFLPFGVIVTDDGVFVGHPQRWFLRFVQRLLEGDRAVLSLLRENPFPDQPPKLIRARFYRYEFQPPAQHAATGLYWKRELLGEYLPPTSLRDLPA